MKKNSPLTITIPLEDLYDCILGHEKRGVQSIPLETASLLHELVKHGTAYKVEFSDQWGEALECPLFWSYKEWSESNQRYEKQKNYSQRERIKSFIFDANIKIVSKYLIKELLYEEESAVALAYSLLKGQKYGNIRAIGIKKLITKEEEL